MLIGQIPSSIIIQKVRPRIWLSSMVVAWAGFTMASAACKTFEQLCIVRFLLGLAEASTYAGCIYIMGSWYKPNELAKRTALFTVAGQVGKMFAGAMMSAMSVLSGPRSLYSGFSNFCDMSLLLRNYQKLLGSQNIHARQITNSAAV